MSNYTHGASRKGKRSAEYRAWTHLLNRCYNTKNAAYERYGGRGIFVAEEWRGKSGFARFLADMGNRPSDCHSIDRIDNNGPYSSDNCRWADDFEQSRNKRNNRNITIGGITKTLAEWAATVGIGSPSFLARLRRGWPEQELLSAPSQRKRVAPRRPHCFHRPLVHAHG